MGDLSSFGVNRGHGCDTGLPVRPRWDNLFFQTSGIC